MDDQTPAEGRTLLRNMRWGRERVGSAEREVTLLARPPHVIEEHGTRQTASDDIQPTVGCYVRRHTNFAAADRGTC